MTWVFVVLYGLFGAMVGAALNQVIDRAPRRMRIWEPLPRCDECDAVLSIAAMLPLIGYLKRRGRCAACGAAIPPRVLWVEIITALLFAILAWWRGPSFELLADSVTTAFFMAIAVIDIEHHLILNRVLYPAVWATMGLAVLRPWLGEPRLLLHGHWQALGASGGASPALAGLSSQIAGGAAGLAIFLVLYLATREGMGDGDVRLALLCGLIVGFPGVLAVTMGAIFLAGLLSAGLLLTRKATRKTAIPFGPFLVVAAWVVNTLGDAYLSGAL
jgi:leader peptidase (prepilin peptidase) / N-methyltransferase